MEAQLQRETKEQSESGKESIEGLQFQNSPYLQYKDLEDYKRQGYGTQGHKQPKPGRGGGATEAPTLSGASVSSEAQFTARDAMHRGGGP